jgi:hypothetical protein
VDGYVQWPIRAVPLRRFRKDQITSSYKGYPDRWAWDRETILLDPTPNGAYSMITDYTANIGTPLAKYSDSSWAFTDSLTGDTISDSFTNAWFVEGADLINEGAKEYLYANVYQDFQNAQVAMSNKEKIRKRLIREGRASQQTSYPRAYF